MKAADISWCTYQRRIRCWICGKMPSVCLDVLCERKAWKRGVISKFSFFLVYCARMCVVCAISNVFVCLLCHRWPKLEPQECEITSTRGISCLRAEKMLVFIFLSDNSVYFHPRQTLFPSNKARRSYFLKRHTIKRHHYVWVPTGVVWFAYAAPLTCFIGIIGGTRCITGKKTNSPVFFRGGGQTQRQKINARFPMST